MRELVDRALYLELWARIGTDNPDCVIVKPDVPSLGYYQVVYVPTMRSDLLGQVAASTQRRSEPAGAPEIFTFKWWRFWEY